MSVIPVSSDLSQLEYTILSHRGVPRRQLAKGSRFFEKRLPKTSSYQLAVEYLVEWSDNGKRTWEPEMALDRSKIGKYKELLKVSEHVKGEYSRLIKKQPQGEQSDVQCCSAQISIWPINLVEEQSVLEYTPSDPNDSSYSQGQEIASLQKNEKPFGERTPRQNRYSSDVESIHSGEYLFDRAPLMDFSRVYPKPKLKNEEIVLSDEEFDVEIIPMGSIQEDKPAKQKEYTKKIQEAKKDEPKKKGEQPKAASMAQRIFLAKQFIKNALNREKEFELHQPISIDPDSPSPEIIELSKIAVEKPKELPQIAEQSIEKNAQETMQNKSTNFWNQLRKLQSRNAEVVENVPLEAQAKPISQEYIVQPQQLKEPQKIAQISSEVGPVVQMNSIPLYLAQLVQLLGHPQTEKEREGLQRGSDLPAPDGQMLSERKVAFCPQETARKQKLCRNISDCLGVEKGHKRKGPRLQAAPQKKKKLDETEYINLDSDDPPTPIRVIKGEPQEKQVEIISRGAPGATPANQNRPIHLQKQPDDSVGPAASRNRREVQEDRQGEREGEAERETERDIEAIAGFDDIPPHNISPKNNILQVDSSFAVGRKDPLNKLGNCPTETSDERRRERVESSNIFLLNSASVDLDELYIQQQLVNLMAHNPPRVYQADLPPLIDITQHHILCRDILARKELIFEGVDAWRMVVIVRAHSEWIAVLSHHREDCAFRLPYNTDRKYRFVSTDCPRRIGV